MPRRKTRKRMPARKWVKSKVRDLLYKARHFGKRRSRKGKTYYEYRRNRGDFQPRRRL